MPFFRIPTERRSGTGRDAHSSSEGSPAHARRLYSPDSDSESTVRGRCGPGGFPVEDGRSGHTGLLLATLRGCGRAVFGDFDFFFFSPCSALGRNCACFLSTKARPSPSSNSSSSFLR